MKRIQITLSFIIALSMSAMAEVNLDYYSSLNGLKGAALKTAVHRVCRDNIEINGSITSVYSAFNNTFKITDSRVISGVEYWWDMYSPDLNPLTMSFSECGYQREHTFPKSWWKDEATYGTGTGNVTYTTAYCDLHHLFPSNGSANQSKSNWPLGEVEKATFDNGMTKTGAPKAGLIYGISDDVAKVFEPADEYKGDFARAYMYVVTAYQDLTWASDCLWMVDNNAYPTFTPWAKELVGRWHRADAVSEKEVNRNDAVQSCQNNRNPFIDFPNLYEYVWGDSIDTPFNIYTTVKSSKATGGDPNVTPDYMFYECSFLGDDGGCTIENGTSQSFDIWTNTSAYGWKGTAYNSGKNNVADSRLVTPEIDLRNAKTAKLTFSHALNYSGPEYMKVYIRNSSGTETDITSSLSWPTKQSWTFVNSGDFDLGDYVGHRIRVVFHYTSDNTAAGTWEIKNISVKGDRNTTSLATVDSHQPATYYSITGYPVNPDTYRGIAIKRVGTSATKILLP